MDIRGAVVLITGASEGIGLATARAFAREGARLALVARTAARLEEIAAELRGQGQAAVAIPADLRDESEARRAVDDTVAHFGRLDILINNAGQAAAGTIAEMNPYYFRQIIDLNIFGPLITMQAAIPVMRAQGGGVIINISSMVSKMRIPGLAAYAATKAALNMLTDTARGELAEEHIRVTTVFPRLTATDFGKHSLGNPETRRRQREGSPAPVDTAEYVAEKILTAAMTEVDEQYMTE